MKNDLLSTKDASVWASKFLEKNVTPSNINYLVTYGKIAKFKENGKIYISQSELEKYYSSQSHKKEKWKEKLGADLNWDLSFDSIKESETTKHVHRLHPYKGKFIPQLVEYFLDGHTDDYKKESYFKKDDIVLDPFCGSGTTLVQANELGLNAIGIDISEFNAMISECKVSKHSLKKLKSEIDKFTYLLENFEKSHNLLDFENELNEKLNRFNNTYFPSPEYKRQIKLGEIDGKNFGKAKEHLFLVTYNHLIKKYGIELTQTNHESFIDKWFIKYVRDELEFVSKEIDRLDDTNIKNVLRIILSRTMRSCRATTHSDLATLKDAIVTTYYCTKHFKICKPIFSILKWWKSYSKDTLKRLSNFEELKTNTTQMCLIGDSRSIDIEKAVTKISPNFAKKLKKNKIRGIFSSPPYVGLIDYHEQHAYSYDLFKLKRKDNQEIGPLFKGKGKAARESYIIGISDVLLNCKKFLAKDYDIFLVSNDNYNLYPLIARMAGMVIVNQYKRPVLNRTEKDKHAYAEIIFHLKDIREINGKNKKNV